MLQEVKVIGIPDDKIRKAFACCKRRDDELMEKLVFLEKLLIKLINK